MTASSILCDTTRMALVGILPDSHSSQNILAQALAGEHVERGKGFVHQQHFGFHDERARDADALAHAAGQLARQRAFEAGQADHVDHLLGAARPFGRRHALRFEAQLDVFLHRQPGKQRERLEHHADAARRAIQRHAVIQHLAFIGADQPGHDAQHGRFSRAGLAEQRDDLAFPEREIDAMQHRARRAVGGAERLAHGFEFEYRSGHGAGPEVKNDGNSSSEQPAARNAGGFPPSDTGGARQSDSGP